MPPRPSSIATTSTRKAPGLSAVTPPAPSRSSGRPAGSGRASHPLEPKLVAAKESERPDRKKTNQPVEPAPKAASLWRPGLRPGANQIKTQESEIKVPLFIALTRDQGAQHRNPMSLSVTLRPKQ